MATLETRNARKRLKRRHSPYWQRIQKGLRLGYRKSRGAQAGVWRGEKYNGVTYDRWIFGVADDKADADGENVLSYENARDQLLKVAKVGKTTVVKTVEDAMEAYLVWFKVNRKSFSDTRSKINTHILPALGKIEIGALTKARIEKWKAGLVTAPKRQRGEKRVHVDLKVREAKRARQATANRIMGVLRAGLNHAHDLTPFPNPETWGAKNYKDVSVARNRHLSLAECTRLINACEPDLRRAVRAALYSGCRYGDVCKAKVADYKDGIWHIPDPKTGKPRNVILNEDGRKFFHQQTIGKPGDAWLFQCDVKDADGAIIGSEPWKASMQRRRMQAASKRGKIRPRVTFHELKHTFCSLALAAGMTMWELSKASGTSMVTLERHYGHLADDHLKQAVEDSIPSFGVDEELDNVASLG